MPPRYVLVRRAPEPIAAPALDQAQQRVVAHQRGPLLVLAGPGTGKTTTLVEAVVERVRRGLRPDQVLVLTFSRRAAEELRERITARLGRTVTTPSAFTFHSWCYALLRGYDAAPGEPPPRLLSGAERDVRIRELLAGHLAGEGAVRWPAQLRPALHTRGFAAEVADVFDRARERGLGPAELAELGTRTGRPGWVAAGRFLEEYLAVLDARGELDYAALVRRALSLLADPGVAAAVAGQVRAVFVDEYQDTDPAQEELLQALAGGGRDLVAVGDPDQSIYAFRGADVGGILGFRDRFRTADGAPAPVVALRTCRRAGPELLAVSRRVAERLPLPGVPAPVRAEHRGLAAAGAPGAAEVRLYASGAAQASGIADLLRRAHLHEGLPWPSMAVLVRSGTRSIPVLQRALLAAGVPVAVAADELPLAREPAVASLLLALRLAGPGEAPLSEDDTRVLLASPLVRAQPGALRVAGRALRAARRDAGEAPRSSGELLRDAVVDPRELVAVPEWAGEPLAHLHHVLAAARAVLADGGTAEEALWALWSGSGWAGRAAAAAAGHGATARSAGRDLDAVLALFAAAARLEERRPRAGARELLAELEAQQIPAAPLEQRAGDDDAVRLLTAHRSKGLEWDLVVVADVQDGGWPDLRRRGSLLEADRLDRGEPRDPPSPQSLLVEERRLFYVALTRARRRLVLTAVQGLGEDAERPSRLLAETGLAVPEQPAREAAVLSTASLVGRLRRAHADARSPALAAAAAGQLRELAAARDEEGQPLVAAADPQRWWGVREWTPGAAPVRPVDEPVQVSASAVQAYTSCPLRWFLERELAATGAASAAQAFGSALHALAQLVADGALPADPRVLGERLDQVWAALPHDAPWHRDAEREQAQHALERLCRWLASARTLLRGEAGFAVRIGDALVRGSVDRLEIDTEGRVHVVDFKTGRTAAGRDAVEEHLQLGVYQLIVRAGGFAELAPDAQPGGAELVWLRLATGELPKVQRQDALGAADTRFADALEETAKGVRGEVFPARPGAGCERCALRPCCPAQPDGAQVVR